MKKRLIFHIDVNSAFLSWESIHRLKEDPAAIDLREIDAVVGGDPASRRGIVLAKSTSAKKYGIITGEPLTEARRKCPGLTIVPSHYELYIEQSDQMIRLLEQYSPTIEKFSIDEAFLDMTETIHLFSTPEKTAARIREEVKNTLGFTVNIGISSNKLLAKMASDFEKPDRCHTLYPEEVKTKMWPLPVRSLFFVGPSAKQKLEDLGISTIGELAHTDPSVLRAHLGNKYSALIHDYANGIDDDPVGETVPENKGYGNRTTLAKDLCDYETANQVLLSLSETLGARLRRDHLLSSCICVELRDWQFQNHSHQLTLSSPTSSTAAIHQAACRLLKESWDLTPIRLIGIRATKLSDEEFIQLSLFEDPRTLKLKQMEKTVDTIRHRFGTDIIKRASFLDHDAPVDHASGKRKYFKYSDDQNSQK